MSRAAFLTFALRGELESTDFMLLGDLITAQGALRPSTRILFDWSAVTSWGFRKPSERQLRKWQGVAQLDRLAIVHDAVGNRQAALLGAIFRERLCLVRSYRIADRARAIEWLTSASP